MREIEHPALRVVAWLGKAALFCLGILAIVALAATVIVLAPVMLASAALPPTAGEVRGPKGRRYDANTTASSVPRKAMAR